MSPSSSKSQRRFMGMVAATQAGDMKNPSPAVRSAAESMSNKDVHDFASTKEKGLPMHKNSILAAMEGSSKAIHRAAKMKKKKVRK